MVHSSRSPLFPTSQFAQTSCRCDRRGDTPGHQAAEPFAVWPHNQAFGLGAVRSDGFYGSMHDGVRNIRVYGPRGLRAVV